MNDCLQRVFCVRFFLVKLTLTIKRNPITSSPWCLSSLNIVFGILESLIVGCYPLYSILFYSGSILKQAILLMYVMLDPFLKPTITKGKVYCQRKQWESIMGLELTTDRLRVRHPTHCYPDNL